MNFDINQLIADLSVPEGQEKQASEAPEVNVPNVADELRSALMTKSASAQVEEASDLGRQLAKRLMEKAASEVIAEPEVILGDNFSELAASVQTTLVKEAGVEAQPHLANAENAGLAAAQSQVNAEAEQSGATVEGQTVESIKKGLTTESAQASGEDLVDRVEDNMQKAAAVSELVAQGHSFYDAAALVTMADEELQKEAAFHVLTEEGYSVDDAVALIKAASEMEEAQYEEMDKQAAFQGLLDEGYGFEEAAELIKVAKAEYDNKPGYGNVIGQAARMTGRGIVEGIGGGIAGGLVGHVVGGVKGGAALSALGGTVGSFHGMLRSSKNYLNEVHDRASKGHSKEAGAMQVVKDKLPAAIKKGLSTKAKVAIGAGAAAAAGGAGYAAKKHMDKKAALDELLEAGHSFDEAVDLIKEAGAVAVVKKQLPAAIKKGLSTKAKVAIGAGAAAAAGGAGYAAKKHMDKKAALNELIEAGHSFDEAVNMVKEAGALSVVKNSLPKALPQAAKAGMSTRTKALIAGGALAAGGAAAYAASSKKPMTKEAAMSELMADGYTFNQALAAVQA